jgi:hypothetical protein
VSQRFDVWSAPSSHPVLPEGGHATIDLAHRAVYQVPFESSGLCLLSWADYLVALRGRKFNHPYVGVTQEFAPYGEHELVSGERASPDEG